MATALKLKKEAFEKIADIGPEARKAIIENREQKNVMFEAERNDMIIIHHESEVKEDGTADVIYYCMKIKDDLQDIDTIIYIDRLSEQKKREAAKAEYKKRRRQS
jgi:hypothetical protein